MDVNKEKCKALKQIRKRIADVLDIDLHQRECTFEGKCSGTCPKCRQEEEQLNQAILAKTAVAAGVVTMAVGLSGCTPAAKGTVEGVGPILIKNAVTEQQLAGEEEYIPPETGAVEYIPPEDELEGDTSYDSEENSTEDVNENTTVEAYELEGDIMIAPSTDYETGEVIMTDPSSEN